MIACKQAPASIFEMAFDRVSGMDRKGIDPAQKRTAA
jgi:hypothetical protein